MAAPTHAQQADNQAQDYIAQARKNMGLQDRSDCGKMDESGSIVVCARQGEDPNRLPLPEERSDLVGKRTSDIPLASSVNPKTRSCGVVGNPYGCSGGIPLQKGFGVIVRGLTKLIDPDAPVEDAPVKVPQKFQGTDQ